jgi:uncharacterized DUF497 family protein
VPLLFDWDPSKASSNLAKHGVTFGEASTVVGDPLSYTMPDPLHSAPDDERFVTIGRSQRQRTLVVVHSDHGGRTWIISTRLATRREQRAYEEAD